MWWTVRLIRLLCYWSVSQTSLEYKSVSAQAKYLKTQAPQAGAVCLNVAHRALKRGLDPTEIIALSWIESRHTWTSSPAGALGPIQALPRYWHRKGDKDMITAGLRAWTYYRDRSHNAVEAVGRYNGGGQHTKYATMFEAHRKELHRLGQVQWLR